MPARRDPQPRVLDLTAPQRAARVEFDSSPAYELLLVLQGLSSPSSWSTYGPGVAWFDQLRSRMSPALRERVITLVESEDCHSEWAHLAGLVSEAPKRDDVRAVIDHLAALPAQTVARSLLESTFPGTERRAHTDLLDAAARGDADARARLREVRGRECGADDQRLFESLLERDPVELHESIVTTLREMSGLLADHLTSLAPVLRLDAERRREQVRGLPFEEAVEVGTNGIHYTLEPGMRRVLLIPHAAMRPWVVIGEHLDTKIFLVAVSDESLAADLDTPPARLVAIVKALGDVQRLRILRRLAAAGPCSLQQVADHIGVAKSTAHHHLVQLRAAGLTVVDLAADKAYRLRDGIAADVAQLLDTYLRGGA